MQLYGNSLNGFNDLTGTIPSENGAGSHVWSLLSFPDNNISGTIPPLFVGGIFQANGNKLSGMIPSIDGASTIILHDNQLEGFVNRTLAGGFGLSRCSKPWSLER